MIDLISRQMVLNVLNDFSNRPVQTVKGIIAELPSVTPCEDAISRTKAIEEIRIYRVNASNDPDIKAFNDGIDTAISVIGHSCPSIAPSRPKGHWIGVSCYDAFGGDYETWMAHGNPIAYHYCSGCKEECYVDEDGKEILSDFCPFCGADMRADREEVSE